MSTAILAHAEWLHTVGCDLMTHLDTTMPVGEPVTMSDRASLYMLAQAILDQRNLLLRGYADDPKVISFPPRSSRPRPGSTHGGAA